MSETISDLRDAFLHNFPEAIKGKDILIGLSSKQASLKRLLRHHDTEEITDTETWKRDAIDYYVEYFSFLAVAEIAGCIKRPLPPDINSEILEFLGNDHVMKYFSEYYPLVLPQIMLIKTMFQYPEDVRHGDPESESVFLKFIRLNNSTRDDQVDSFLWLLDGGQYQESTGKWISLSDLRRTLRNPKRYNKILSDVQLDSYEKEVLIGFLKYCNFLKQFHLFIKSIKSNKLLQSALWHYYAYWFERIGDKMTGTLEAFFTGIETHPFAVKKTLAIELVKKDKKAYQAAIHELCSSTKYSREIERYWTQMADWVIRYLEESTLHTIRGKLHIPGGKITHVGDGHSPRNRQTTVHQLLKKES